MTISIYDLSIGSYLQALEGVTNTLNKGAEYCQANDIDLNDVVEASIYPDMFAFRFQVFMVKHQSLGVIAGLQKGVFSPPAEVPNLDYAGLQAMIVETTQALAELPRESIEGLAGKPVVFKFGETEIPFTAENFLMSFSLPNLYFHAATAYDILRMKGTPLGKRDYLGQMRVGI